MPAMGSMAQRQESQRVKGSSVSLRGTAGRRAGRERVRRVLRCQAR